MKATEPEKFIVIGTVGTAFGVKGWVKVNSHTNPKDNILDYTPWYINTKTGWEEIEVAERRVQSSHFVAHFVGCDDRDTALGFTHREIAIRRDQLPTPDEGEYYWTDLEGLTVIDQAGATLGTVDYIMETGANDVLVIKGEKPCLIPFLLNQTITRVDLEKQCIHVDWDADE